MTDPTNTTVWVRKDHLARWKSAKRKAQVTLDDDLAFSEFIDRAVTAWEKAGFEWPLTIEPEKVV